MKNKLCLRAYTLLEIVVSLIILSIGILFLTKTMLLSKANYLKYVDDSVAVNVAYLKMQEFLMQSYDKMGTDCSRDGTLSCQTLTNNNFATSFRQIGRDVERPEFNWEVNVFQERLFNEADASWFLPYKSISSFVSFDPRDQEGVRTSTDRRFVQLFNIVPYPYYHTDFIELVSTGSDIIPDGTAADGWNPNNPDLSADQCVARDPGHVVTINGSPLRKEVRYQTRKDINIFYNVVTRLAPGGFYTLDHNVFTTVWVIGGVFNTWSPVSTRTLVIGQRVINNAVSLIDPITRDPIVFQPGIDYTIEVRIFKTPVSTGIPASGDVFLRSANMIVMAVEHKH